MTSRIDAHHHVWDLAARDQPWITGPAMAPIRRSFGIDERRARLARRHHLARAHRASDVVDAADGPAFVVSR